MPELNANPAQWLMSHRTRTNFPSASELLQPNTVEVTEKGEKAENNVLLQQTSQAIVEPMRRSKRHRSTIQRRDMGQIVNNQRN